MKKKAVFIQNLFSCELTVSNVVWWNVLCFEFVAKSSEPELILWYFKIQSINDFLNLCEIWEKKIKIHVFSISCIFSNTIRSFDAHCDKLAS